MEQISQEYQKGRSDYSPKTEIAESVQSETHKIDNSNENQGYQRKNPLDTKANIDVKNNVKEDEPPAYMDDAQGEVNMEASISADDVMRAGGFGARDDISSFLPVASDFTDFEASLLDARVYEEPQEEISRPGLGWTKSEK